MRRIPAAIGLAFALWAQSVWMHAQADAEKRLTLRESIEIALKENPRIEVAKHEADVQLIQLDRERPSGLHPDVMLRGSNILTTPQVRFPNGAGPIVTPTFRPGIGVSFSQTVFHFGARLAARRASFIERAVSIDRRKTDAEVVLDVKKAYFQLLAASKMVGVAEDAVSQVEAHTRVARVALEAGTAMPLDVTRADVALLDVKNNLIRAQNGLALARANFNHVLGRDQDSTVEIEPIVSPPPDPPPLKDAVEIALQKRPELVAMRETIRGLEASVELAKTQKLPSASVRGEWVHQRESAFVRSPSFTAALEVSVPLFDHKASTDVREARARTAQMQSQLKEAESGIALEVRQAWLNFQASRQKLVNLPQMIASTEEAARIAALRFEAGRATNLEVTDAFLQLRQSKADYLGAASDLQIAAAELIKAMGTTFE